MGKQSNLIDYLVITLFNTGMRARVSGAWNINDVVPHNDRLITDFELIVPQNLVS